MRGPHPETPALTPRGQAAAEAHGPLSALSPQAAPHPAAPHPSPTPSAHALPPPPRGAVRPGDPADHPACTDKQPRPPLDTTTRPRPRVLSPQPAVDRAQAGCQRAHQHPTVPSPAVRDGRG